MTIMFYMLVCLCLVIVKTTLIPGMPLLEKFYDLLIPIIIYLGMFRPRREGIPIVLFFGMLMDSLCGGAMGLYLATYVWLYMIVRWLGQYLQAGNVVLMAGAVGAGVALEILILLGYMAVLAPDAKVPVDAARTALMQIGWAMVTGPLILMMTGQAQKKIDAWRKKIFVDNNALKGA